MTTSTANNTNTNTADSAFKTSISLTGNRQAGFATHHGAAIGGAIIASLAHYGETGNAVSSLAGALVGSVVAYAIVDTISPVLEAESVTGKILAGSVSAMMGMSFSAMASGLTSNISKIGQAEAE